MRFRLTTVVKKKKAFLHVVATQIDLCSLCQFVLYKIWISPLKLLNSITLKFAIHLLPSPILKYLISYLHWCKEVLLILEILFPISHLLTLKIINALVWHPVRTINGSLNTGNLAKNPLSAPLLFLNYYTTEMWSSLHFIKVLLALCCSLSEVAFFLRGLILWRYRYWDN